MPEWLQMMLFGVAVVASPFVLLFLGRFILDKASEAIVIHAVLTGGEETDRIGNATRGAITIGVLGLIAASVWWILC